MAVSGGGKRQRRPSARKQPTRGRQTVPAVRAKITAPAAERVYPRTRLFKELDQAFRHHSLVWISAPGGYGKTLLAASYLKARKYSPLWYQVDAGDADPAALFHHLGFSTQTLAPRRSPLAVLTPQYLAGLPVFCVNFFRELGERLKRRSLLIFDNYQELPFDAPAHDLLASGLAELPSDARVLVLSRTDPPQAYARWRASGKFLLLDADVLQLDIAESAGIARMYKPHTLPPATVQRLHELTRGWAAGLVLLMQQNASDLQVDPGTKGNGLPGVLFDYFASQVWQLTEPDVQDFLRRTALLVQMTAETATSLSDNARATEILDDLKRQNYFLVSHPGTPRTFEYHPLFREFLLKNLAQSLAPEALRDLRVRAAKLLADTGHHEAAAELLIEANDHAALGQLALNQAASLITRGRHNLIATWIQAIPESERLQEPWLDYWLGVSIQWTQPLLARDHFESAFRKFEQSDDRYACALTWSAVIDTYIVSWSEFKTMDVWLERMQRFDTATVASLPPETQAQLSVAIFVALMYRRPAHPDMKYWANRAEETFRSSDSITLQLSVGNHLLLYLIWWLGDMGRARQLLDALPTQGRWSDSDRKSGILSSAIRSGLSWMLADNREAIDAAGQGLALGIREGFHLWDTFLACQAIFGCLSENDLTTAGDYMTGIAAALDPRKYLDIAYAHYVKGWYLDCQGAREQALEALLFSKENIDRVGTPFFAAAVYNDLGRLLVESGKQEEGMSLIDAALDIGNHNDLDTIRYVSLRSKAELLQNTGDMVGCLEALRGFLEISRRCGFMNHAWWRPQPMVRLYATALEFGIEPEYVKDVIRKRRLSAPRDRPSVDAWPYPIKVYTLGRFSLLRDDKPVRFEGKAQKKPLELLKLLIALGGRDVAEARLLDVLWPNAEADQAYQNVKATLHRLRKLIGEEVLRLSDGKLTLDSQQVWVDVWSCERLLNESRDLLHTGETRRGVELSQQAIRLYRGAFLSADDQSFVMPLRERLRSKVLALIADLARNLCQKRDCRESLAIYQQGLEIDPLAEDFHRGLMGCYECLGQSAEALKAYERCRSLLKSQLGIEPSAQTRELEQAIREAVL